MISIPASSCHQFPKSGSKMQLVSSFFLLGLCHGALGYCYRDGPPEAVTSGYFQSFQRNGFTVIEGLDVQVIFSPASPGTTAGVVKLKNTAGKVRWVRLVADNTIVDLEIEGDQPECKTNLILKNLQGANIFKRI